MTGAYFPPDNQKARPPALGREGVFFCCNRVGFLVL